MKTRREFILHSGLVACGTLIVSSSNLLACPKGKVSFNIKKGKKGCSRCIDAFNDILANPKFRARLDSLFPNAKSVAVYARKWPSTTRIPKPSIALGTCNKALKNRATVYVPGCAKQMKSAYILKKLEDSLKKG